MSLNPDEVRGGEFDWFAVDAKGHIALCSTAGYGEIPASVLAASTDEVSPIDCIEELVRTLPATGKAESQGRGPGSCEEWPALAQRGFFVYDWKHWDGPYERIVVPSHPVVSATIPDVLLSKMLPLATDLCFGSTSEFSMQSGSQSLSRTTLRERP